MSAAGFRRGSYVELASVNEAEGRSQWAAGPTKLAEEMARANIDEEPMEEGEVPNLDEVKNYEHNALIDAQAEADAAAHAKLDASVDVMLRSMTQAQIDGFTAYVLAQVKQPDAPSPVANQEAPAPPSPMVADQKHQVSIKTEYVNIVTIPAASKGKRKSIALVPQQLEVFQAPARSKKDIDAEIRHLEIQHGCDLSDTTIAAEKVKRAKIPDRIIRLKIEIQMEEQRLLEYNSKEALWSRVSALRSIGVVSGRIDPKLNAPLSLPTHPPTPQEKAAAKLRKAQEKARLLGVMC